MTVYDLVAILLVLTALFTYRICRYLHRAVRPVYQRGAAGFGGKTRLETALRHFGY